MRPAALSAGMEKMHRGLFGRKLGMVSIFESEGLQLPVTVLEVGPCIVTQIKTAANDGYNALQLGFGKKQAKRANKPLQGHFGKSGGEAYAFLKEVRVDDPSGYLLGQVLTVEIFRAGEHIDVSGVSKGRGFAGVVKRWGFRGGKESHGSMFHRAPGSIGSSAWPSRVIKGRKMAGHYGNQRVTVKNLEIVDVRPEQHLLIVKGAVPGSTLGLVEVRKSRFQK